MALSAHGFTAAVVYHTSSICLVLCLKRDLFIPLLPAPLQGDHIRSNRPDLDRGALPAIITARSNKPSIRGPGNGVDSIPVVGAVGQQMVLLRHINQLEGAIVAPSGNESASGRPGHCIDA